MTTHLTPLEIMTKLISFPTVSRDTNLPLIDWVQDYLASHGIESHRWPDPDQPHKAALFAHVGPWEDGAVVLSGHTDVVPVDGQDWTSDPFTVVERDGRYFGRGTCDMKGFDALAIWALVEAHRSGVRNPLQLALSFDEELGCTGAPPMIEAMQPVLPKGSAVIVGEPSGMKAVTGHKGGQGLATRVVGHEVHSSLIHMGVNAIMASAPLLTWVNDTNAANRDKPPSNLAAMFDPPFSTAHVGMISGGTAHNITAGECDFAVSFRVIPDEDPQAYCDAYTRAAQQVEQEIRAIHPEARVELSPWFRVPALVPEDNGAAEQLVRQLTGDNDTHVVSYGTEAGQFQEAGYSAVICGPGDIAQAHQADEFISVEQFNAGHAFVQRLVTRLQEE